MRGGPFCPAERLLPLLRKQVAKHDFLILPQAQKPSGGVQNVAERVGISDRRIRAILKGETQKVEFATLDAILTGLDLSHLSWYSPEEGGFQDIYEAERPDYGAVRRQKDAKRPNGRKKDACACGRMKQARSERCVSCVRESQKSFDCVTCGKARDRYATTGLCRLCYDAKAKPSAASSDYHRRKTERTLGTWAS